ncbi:hypothetical protein C2S52_015253 [Perilla frutescens var. hirtella]|nr:hypothetical protein C2S52_015253 [Perilla frutescens var. hirtella]
MFELEKPILTGMFELQRPSITWAKNSKHAVRSSEFELSVCVRPLEFELLTARYSKWRPTAFARRRSAQERWQAEADEQAEQQRNQIHYEETAGNEEGGDMPSEEEGANHEGEDDDDKILRGMYAARAYLVCILGCTLFTDKTGDRISCNYLRLFDDTEEQIAGFLTLLEAWIYEHFPTLGRPQQNADYRAGQPYAMRWAQQAHGAVSEDAVIWDPYVRLRDGGERPEVTFYEGCLTTCDVVEPYLPERVLRQFGRMQTIPHPPLDPILFRRGKKPGQYRVVWGMLASFFEQWESHKLSPERRGRVAHPAWACFPEYLQWYCSISYLRVQNEAADPLIDPLPTFSPWDGIQSAIGYLDPLVTRWRAQDPDISLPYVMSQVEEAFEALNFRTGQHGQPTGVEDRSRGSHHPDDDVDGTS